jgi:Holliday junction resolvase
MATPEAKTKAAVRKILETSGAYFFMPVSNGMGRHGIPDVIACKNGHFFGIECKAGKGKTTALQDRELLNITNTGGTALIINEHNLDELKKALDEH